MSRFGFKQHNGILTNHFHVLKLKYLTVWITNGIRGSEWEQWLYVPEVESAKISCEPVPSSCCWPLDSFDTTWKHNQLQNYIIGHKKEPHSTYHLGGRIYPLPPDLHWRQYPHLYDLYWLQDSSNLYKLMTSSLCTCFPLYHYTSCVPTCDN